MITSKNILFIFLIVVLLLICIVSKRSKNSKGGTYTMIKFDKTNYYLIESELFHLDEYADGILDYIKNDSDYIIFDEDEFSLKRNTFRDMRSYLMAVLYDQADNRRDAFQILNSEIKNLREENIKTIKRKEKEIERLGADRRTKEVEMAKLQMDIRKVKEAEELILSNLKMKKDMFGTNGGIKHYLMLFTSGDISYNHKLMSYNKEDLKRLIKKQIKLYGTQIYQRNESFFIERLEADKITDEEEIQIDEGANELNSPVFYYYLDMDYFVVSTKIERFIFSEHLSENVIIYKSDKQFDIKGAIDFLLEKIYIKYNINDIPDSEKVIKLIIDLNESYNRIVNNFYEHQEDRNRINYYMGRIDELKDVDISRLIEQRLELRSSIDGWLEQASNKNAEETQRILDKHSAGTDIVPPFYHNMNQKEQLSQSKKEDLGMLANRLKSSFKRYKELNKNINLVETFKKDKEAFQAELRKLKADKIKIEEEMRKLREESENLRVINTNNIRSYEEKLSKSRKENINTIIMKEKEIERLRAEIAKLELGKQYDPKLDKIVKEIRYKVTNLVSQL